MLCFGAFLLRKEDNATFYTYPFNNNAPMRICFFLIFAPSKTNFTTINQGVSLFGVVPSYLYMAI